MSKKQSVLDLYRMTIDHQQICLNSDDQLKIAAADSQFSFCILACFEYRFLAPSDCLWATQILQDKPNKAIIMQSG